MPDRGFNFHETNIMVRKGGEPIRSRLKGGSEGVIFCRINDGRVGCKKRGTKINLKVSCYQNNGGYIDQ